VFSLGGSGIEVMSPNGSNRVRIADSGADPDWGTIAVRSPIRCMITGTSGDHVLHGTIHDDVIYGRDGGDTIKGGWGNDTLKGGDDPDVLVRGPGRDLMLGNAGNDRLNGKDGVRHNDAFSGGRGENRCQADSRDCTASCRLRR